MADRLAGILTELNKNEEEIIKFFNGLNFEQLGLTVYLEDPGWSVRQVLAHLITIEGTMQWLFKDILAGGPGSPEDFDVDRFNRSQPKKLDGLSLNQLFERFRSVRGATIDIVRGMEDEDLDREGRHAFHGHGKLERFVVWAYEHARLHLDDIRKVLG